MTVELIRPGKPATCQCGCGEPVRIAKRTSRADGTVKGEPLCFVHGHNRRGRNRTWYRDPLARRWYVNTRDGGNYYWYRIVAWDQIGRELLPDEQVHHINGNSEDDRPENLRVVQHAEHVALHAEMRARRKAAMG